MGQQARNSDCSSCHLDHHIRQVAGTAVSFWLAVSNLSDDLNPHPNCSCIHKTLSVTFNHVRHTEPHHAAAKAALECEHEHS